MTEDKNIQLGIIEKSILKKLILNEPKRPDSYTFFRIYKFFDYKTHEEEEIKKALKSLVEGNYLIFDNGYYSLSRETFLRLKQQYKFHILMYSDYNKIFIPAIFAVIASIISIFPGFDRLLKSSKPSTEFSKSNIELRIEAIEDRLNNLEDTIQFKAINNHDTLQSSKEINVLRSKYSELSENLQSLNSLLQDNPKRFVEIATINKDLDELETKINNNNESLKREIDRISSYNNTLIVFMITFLVAYIGIGIFTNISRKRTSPL